MTYAVNTYDSWGILQVGNYQSLEEAKQVFASICPRFQESCHPSDQYIRGLEDMTNAPIQRGR